MHDYLTIELYAKERYEDALREASQRALARRAQSNLPSRPSAPQRLAARFGSLLVHAGMVLQSRSHMPDLRPSAQRPALSIAMERC